jgi:hypothetical protein
MTSTNIYGYEDTTNAYGYGDASPDTDSKLGYEAPTPCCDTDKYGYGPSKDESNNPYGYGDSNPNGNGNSNQHGYGDTNPYGYGNETQPEQPPRRERPRRRCSVTKYSLEEAQQQVKEIIDSKTDEAPSLALTDEAPSSSLDFSVEEVSPEKKTKSSKKRWFSRRKK